MVDTRKMCGNKVSFTTKVAADNRASKHNQRVYLCPICQCWHCTSSKENEQEFIDKEYHLRVVACLEKRYKTVADNRKAKIKRLNLKIEEYKKETARLRKEIRILKHEKLLQK